MLLLNLINLPQLVTNIHIVNTGWDSRCHVVCISWIAKDA